MWRMTRKGEGGISSGSGGRGHSGGDGWAWVRGGRPCFLGLSLPCLKLGVRPAMSDMYNMHKIENIRHMLTK